MLLLIRKNKKNKRKNIKPFDIFIVKAKSDKKTSMIKTVNSFLLKISLFFSKKIKKIYNNIIWPGKSVPYSLKLFITPIKNTKPKNEYIAGK